MKYDYAIKDDAITVTIKDTTADRFLHELCTRLGCDAVCSLDSDAVKEAIEEMANEYIAEERPQVDYWHNDEVYTVDVLRVEIHCGRIADEHEFFGEVGSIRYNAIQSREDYA